MFSDFPVIEEIKAEYKDLRIKGNGRTETVEKIKYNYQCELEAEDDSLLFWIGLADAQFACKELSAEIAQRGLEAIKILETSELAHLLSMGQLKKRKEWYSQPPMPERKKIRAGKKFQCSWDIGDTFAYCIKGEEAEKYHLAGKYMLLRKVSETDFDGKIIPVVSMTLWDKPKLPKTVAEFKEIPFLRINNGRQFTRSDQYEYRTEILFSSQRQVEQLELQFVGNFAHVEMPKDEVVFTIAGEINMAFPKCFDYECCLAFRRDRFYRTGEWLE